MTTLERVAYLFQSKETTYLSSVLRALWQTHFTFYSGVKRALDFILATLGLILSSPIFIVIAIMIKLEDGGPVFFRQLRTGRNGKEFYIYKFRSMAINNNVHDTSCEDQYTKVGRFIRSISVDEIPQFINIVKGDMAFIGPRPWITDYYAAMNDRERMRTMVRPGITGLAQASGRNGISIFDKIGYDLTYVKHFSAWMDLKVIFWSVKTVLKKESVDAGKNVIHNELNELRRENHRKLAKA